MDAGRARRTVIELGRQTGQAAEVTAGLAEGTRVILHLATRSSTAPARANAFQ
jgi:multidrug efflux pump subunit AcrA (membrane-fusion protein)